MKNRCAYLEQKGIEVSSDSAIWDWKEYENAYGTEKRSELDATLAGSGITFSKVSIDNNWDGEIEYFTNDIPDWDSIRASPEFQDFYSRNDHEHGFEVSAQTYHYGGAADAPTPKALSLAGSAFSWLKKNDCLNKIKSQNYNVKPERECEDDEEPEPEDDEDEWEDEM